MLRVQIPRVILLVLCLALTPPVAATDLNEVRFQFSCRGMLLSVFVVGSILAVGVPLERFRERNLSDGHQIDHVHWQFKNGVTLPLDAQDRLALGTAYVYYHQFSQWGPVWPYMMEEPLYRQEQVRKFYEVLSKADKAGSGALAEQMEELGVPGKLHAGADSKEYGQFRDYFGGGWSLENPLEKYYLQNGERKRQLALLLGTAIEPKLDAAILKNRSKGMIDVWKFFKQLEEQVD